MNIKRGTKYKKRIAIATIISIVLLVICLNIMHLSIVEYINSQIEVKIIKVSEILSQQINGDRHQQIVENKDLDSNFYYKMNSFLLDTKEMFPEISAIYTIVQTEDSNIWKVILTTDIGDQNKTIKNNNEDLTIDKVYLGSMTSESSVYKKQKNSSSVYTVIHNSMGEHVAVLGVDIKENVTVELVENLLNKVSFFSIIILLILGLICLWVIDDTLKPVEVFIEEARDIGKGRKRSMFLKDIDGELGLLATEFNKILDKNYYEKEVQQEFINRIIEEKENIFEVYKNIIEAVTQGKILLLSSEVFIEGLANDFPLYSTKLIKAQDITRCRREVDDLLTKKEFPWWNGKNRRNTLLCLSEAVTNVIKHAGTGEILLSVKKDKLTIYILDEGEGIDLKKLPYAIFIKGFSTKQTSLGVGFLLMEKCIDKIILSTSKKGTFLALKKQMLEDV